MDDESPDPVHPSCDCLIVDHEHRIYSACTHAVQMLDAVAETHDICPYNVAVMIYVQMIHMREQAGVTDDQMKSILAKAEDTAEKMYAYSAQKYDEERRRKMC